MKFLTIGSCQREKERDDKQPAKRLAHPHKCVPCGKRNTSELVSQGKPELRQIALI
jgi:hypothetical protein